MPLRAEQSAHAGAPILEKHARPPRGATRVISAQFRIQLPEGMWVRDLSERFPRATFRLLSGFPTGERAVELGEVVADDPETVVTAMREHPAIENYNLLESANRRALGKYESLDTDLYEFARLSSLPVEFPIEVTNGWYEFDLTGTQAEFDGFRETLEDLGARYELQSVVSDPGTEQLLTDRQREILETAVREGYFEVPRECSLADLAERVGADKSTVSTVLRRGEANLVKRFLTGPDRQPL